MSRSQNGWTANRRDLCRWFTVPGTGVRLLLRSVYAGPLLVAFARCYHLAVEPLVEPGCWSYAERPIRGLRTILSNHSSGTAVDLNAPRHPLGRRGTFTPTQRREVERLLALAAGTIRWGGHYRVRKDEMHFEVDTTNLQRILQATQVLEREAVRLQSRR